MGILKITKTKKGIQEKLTFCFSLKFFVIVGNKNKKSKIGYEYREKKSRKKK